MLKIFSYMFFFGVTMSIYSGVGLKTGMIDKNIAALFALFGLIFTGIGFAGRRYFLKMK